MLSISDNKKSFTLFVLLIVIIISCSEHEIMPQSNPFDPNGDNFQNNQAPNSITTNSKNCLWDDFDRDINRGDILYKFKGYDPNEIFDTITYTVSLGESIDELEQKYYGRDTFYIVENVAPEQKVYCELKATDIYDMSFVITDTIIVSSQLPPPPPTDIVVNFYSTAYISFWWSASGDVYRHRVYRADKWNGHFKFIAVAPINPYFYDHVEDYNFYYYIVSSYNSNGECKMKIPFQTKKADTNLEEPHIRSVSKKEYKDMIKVRWDSISSSFKHVHYIIYRKTSWTGYYKKIAAIPYSETIYTLTYNDTAFTTDSCYYSITARDTLNGESKFSTPGLGLFDTHF